MTSENHMRTGSPAGGAASDSGLEPPRDFPAEPGHGDGGTPSDEAAIVEDDRAARFGHPRSHGRDVGPLVSGEGGGQLGLVAGSQRELAIGLLDGVKGRRNAPRTPEIFHQLGFGGIGAGGL